MIRAWICGGRGGEPVSEVKPNFYAAAKAKGRMLVAGSNKLPGLEIKDLISALPESEKLEEIIC